MPLNSIEQADPVSFLSHSNILNLSGVNMQSANESFESQYGSSLDSSRPDLANFEKELIMQIQKDFHCRAEGEGHFQSITPQGSLTSIISRSIPDNGIRASLFNIRLSTVLNQEISNIDDDSLINKFGDSSEIEWEPRMSIPFSKNSDTFLFRKMSLDSQSSEEAKAEEECLSFAEEGEAQHIKYYRNESLASKNVLMNYFHTKPQKYKLPQKLLNSVSISFSEIVETLENEKTIDWPDISDPLLRKMLICQNQDTSDAEEPTEVDNNLETISAVSFSGFTSALALEYSNLDNQNRASTDARLKPCEKPSLFSEKIVKSISISKVS